MKTIHETVKENEPFTKNIIAALEAREKERDEAERERVLAVVFKELYKLTDYVLLKSVNNATLAFSIQDKLYPPKKLPAGYYWVRLKDNSEHRYWSCGYYRDDFEPLPIHEYRRWDDPPPQVTGGQASLKSVCCDRNADNMTCDCPKEKS